MRRASRQRGLPPELAATDHLGKQLERKRRAEAEATRITRATQTALDFAAPVAEEVRPAANFEEWFAHQGWQPFAFQREVWRAMQDGRSGLLHASTGTGKTYAVWGGAIARLGELSRTSTLGPRSSALGPRSSALGPRSSAGATRVLWITPMRALAADTVRALQRPLAALDVDWTLAARTGDTESAEKTRQTDKPPTILVTTPESLTLLLARAEAMTALGKIEVVIVDEWHELLGNKRGVQTQLALSRIRRAAPRAIVWGLSATLGDLDAARDGLLGEDARSALIVRGAEPKQLVLDTLIPASMERFPWGGHIGLKLLPEVIAEVEKSATTLIFTNVRSQAEIWYQALLTARPDWAGVLALHHGSLDRAQRDWVEAGLKAGTLKAVVCTSSLDLGVDFLPVERVLQIGSPKGIARLMQRAGRSGHAPGRVSRATIVPTNALELVEAAAARRAAGAQEGARRIEARRAPDKPIDVLVQHLVTIALGGGFTPNALFDEVRAAHSYRDLTRAEFDWALAFVERGGESLTAYPDYHRVKPDAEGVWRVPSAAFARRHRMSIGTIVSDAAMQVAWMSGGRLGTIEESFIARLSPGDAFTFSGRVLELVRVHELTAYVKKATRKKGVIPQWGGAKMSFSSELADMTLDTLARSHTDLREEPELVAVAPLLAIQRRWSRVPDAKTLIIEVIESREGHHFFCYAFAGRGAHIGLGSLIGYRAARHDPGHFSISMNDYGFELLSSSPTNWQALYRAGLFSTDNLLEDVLASLKASELAQSRFREIARVAGLVFQGYPGAPKSTRQLQASSGLFYNVFRQHDPGNLLLTQAEREALEQELEIGRLRRTLERIATLTVAFVRPPRFTPFSFPLMVERFREEVGTERLDQRVQRLLRELEEAAGASEAG
ncbi:MAG: ligase-associated DNA damage response DEXH box helicase [Burkholderiales bacterium]|nr:ligase-associated DNA damage response DEXH box helicase [Burkholderiales bacterium]